MELKMSENNQEKKIPMKNISYQVDTISVNSHPQFFYIRKKKTSANGQNKQKNTPTKQVTNTKKQTQPKNNQQNKHQKNNTAKQPVKATKQQDENSSSLNILAYFNPHNNTMTVNYDKETGEEKKSEDVIVHEAQHNINYKNGLYKYPMSPENVYKTNMYDEISATTASLLSLRQKYLETGDISVFDAQGGRFYYYKNAVISGEITPGSNKQEDFDKEMKLIANGTQEMWQKKIAPNYAGQNFAYARDYSDKYAEYYKYDDENYQRSKKIAMNIGGVDFSQYLEKDVEIPSEGKFLLDNSMDTIAYNSIRKSREDKERAGTYDGPENKPINFVECLSVYKEWEDKDGSSVSPVLEMEIPDMEADFVQKPNSENTATQDNGDDLKSTLKAQAQSSKEGNAPDNGNERENNAQTQSSENADTPDHDSEQLKAQIKNAAEERKQKQQKPAYQYSPDKPLNEQLHEAAANSKAVVQNDNTEELNRVREKAANQNKSRESGSTTNSPAEPTAQNAPNTATQNNNSNIIMQQRQNSRS